jgi:hypothetical protein
MEYVYLSPASTSNIFHEVTSESLLASTQPDRPPFVRKIVKGAREGFGRPCWNKGCDDVLRQLRSHMSCLQRSEGRR